MVQRRLSRVRNLYQKLTTRLGKFEGQRRRDVMIFIVITGMIGYLIISQIHQRENQRRRHVSLSIIKDPGVFLLISSYLNGGGTLLGEVLKAHPNTFYMLEPLLRLSPWKYYNNETTQCSMVSDICITNNKTLSTALTRAKAAFSCKLSGLIAGSDPQTSPDNEGNDAWSDYGLCISLGFPPSVCIRELAEECKKSNVRIVKESRLSLSLVEKLLSEDSSYTALHMFRDPRAVIHGIIKEDVLKQFSSLVGIRIYAKGLCSRMARDFIVGKRLLRRFPTRFKMILFEDFMADMEGFTRLVMRFVGISFKTQDKYSVLQTFFEQSKKYSISKAASDFNVTENDVIIEKDVIRIMRPVEEREQELNDEDAPMNQETSSNDTLAVIPFNKFYAQPFNWRSDIQYIVAKVVDRECHTVFKRIGYNEYNTRTQLRDTDKYPSFGKMGLYPL